ncbi:MAG: WD40 repeat domain-containing protein [Planctomycetota bacterium]
MDLNLVDSSMTRQPLDGAFIATSKDGKTVPLDTRTGLPVRITHLQEEDGTLVFQKPSPSHWAFVSPLGSRLLIRGRIRAPWLLELDPRSAQEGWDPRRLLLDAHGAAVDHVALSHDGSLLASLSVDEGRLRVWDRRAGESVSSYSLSADEAGRLVPLVGFSADDERLLLVSRITESEGKVLEWTVRSGEVQSYRIGASGLSEAITRVTSLADSQPGDRLAAGLEVGGNGGTALSGALTRAFGPVNGLEVLEPPPGDFELQDLSLHPTGGLTAVVHDGFRNPVARYQVNMQGSLLLLDPATAEVVHDVPLERGLFRVAYSPDGQWLAIGTRGGHVQVVETTFFTLQLEFVAHAAQVSSLGWTPDGEQLVTASAEGEIAVWDPSGELLDLDARDAWRARRRRMATEPLTPSRSDRDRLDRSAARIEAMCAAGSPRMR